MNKQQREQQANLASANARRLKFVRQVEEIMDRVCKQIEGETLVGANPPSVSSICEQIKGAIYEEMIWRRG